MTRVSLPETLLEEQLNRAGIGNLREVTFAKPRKFRADFLIFDGGPGILVEVEGGTWIAGRHSRGAGFEKDCEKQYLATLKGHRYIRVTSNQVEDGTALSWIQSLLETKEAA